MKQSEPYRPGELERVVYAEDDAGGVSQSQPQERRRPRLAIIGCGSRGLRLALACDAVNRSDIGGAFDPYADLRVFTGRVKRLKDFRQYATLRELCADPAIDGLIVTTPVHTHLDVMRECVASGKAILLDKPIAHTLEDSLAIAELVRGCQGVFYMGLQYRQKPVYREAFKLLRQGAVGAVKMVYIREHRGPYLDKWMQWNKFARYSGGAMVEKCCHYFDLFNVVAGARPAKVYCAGAMDVNFVGFEHDGQRADVIDNSFTIVEYENGVRACLNFCMFARQPDAQETLIVNGDRGGLYAFDEPQHRIRLAPNSRDESPVEIRLEVRKQIEEAGHSGADYYEMRDFVAAIQGRANGPLPTAEDGVWSVAAGVAAERSIKTGEPVRVRDLFGQPASGDSR